MSWMPDVNVLVYAHSPDDPVHEFYRRWLEGSLGGIESVSLSVLVAVGFVRVTTHARGIGRPAALSLALAAVESIAAHPSCHVVAPGPRHLEIFAALCRATDAAGKLVADAAHAAVAIEHGCTLVTRDRDFRAFVPHGLRWKYLAP